MLKFSLPPEIWSNEIWQKNTSGGDGGSQNHFTVTSYRIWPWSRNVRCGLPHDVTAVTHVMQLNAHINVNDGEYSWKKTLQSTKGPIGAAHGKRYTTSKFSIFVFSLTFMEDLTKKPALKTAWKNIESSQSYSTFCDTRVHAYAWHVMTLIAVFSTLRLRTLCTFSHEPPQLVSLTLCFTTQQVDRQREDKIKGNETMAYHHGGEGGKGWLSAKVLRVALREDEKRKLEKLCNKLNEDVLLTKSNKKWLRNGRSKLACASPLTTQKACLQTADRSGSPTTNRWQTTMLTEPLS